MKLSLDERELYPVFCPAVESPFEEDAPDVITLTDEELKDFKRVADEWNAWQARLGKLAGGTWRDGLAPHQLYDTTLFEQDANLHLAAKE